MKWLAPEHLVLLVFIVLGLRLSSGHGIVGFVLLLVVGAVLGAVMGLIGRRVPMIYRQNRRDRRRRFGKARGDDDTTHVF